ncbi:secondary thiamine-phosphate synthase enzyme YjbQ [Candidatus Woesearchaeota archaeon]|nr:secondary thiamine-phosphate synthase enzyme YjbQ [Candidatus Woesearchaeota archaeon]
MIKEIKINTKAKYDMVDIQKDVEKIVSESKVKNGICSVFVAHATAAVMINENYDPNVCDDILDALAQLVREGKWRHDRVDDNAAAHIKSSIVGASQTIPVKDGKLVLGTWQNIMVAEFDGPRDGRNVYVSVVGE